MTDDEIESRAGGLVDTRAKTRLLDGVSLQRSDRRGGAGALRTHSPILSAGPTPGRPPLRSSSPLARDDRSTMMGSVGRPSDARERLIQATIDLVWPTSYGAVGVDAMCEHADVKK